MPLAATFKYAIDKVDDDILLADVIDETYGYAEFSYTCSGSTYTIRGGSFVACDHGAVHLLEAMGFRFLSPNEQFWKLPAGPLPTNLSRTKTQFWMPYSSYSQQYGNSWETPPVIAWRTTINNENSRFFDLIGWKHQPFPSGHRQGSVVDAFPAFFNANPHLLAVGTIPSPVVPGRTKGFALATMTPAEKDIVATLAAAYILKEGQNTASSLYLYHRTEYDAIDGDTNSSDDYFGHGVLTCQKVRAGTAALNTYGYGSFTEFNSYPAYAGVSDAQLGIYAYAGHKAKPSFDIRPYIYVGVTLGFSPASTWVPRMQAHKDNSVTVMARDYLDPHQYTMGMPMNGRRQSWNHPNTYDAYYAAGCRGMQGGDGNGNWLLNLVANRQLNMKLRTGSYTYAAALAEVVSLLDDDPAVEDFYNYIMDPVRQFHRFSLYELMLIVDDMADSWYKDYFEQLMTVARDYLYLPLKPSSPVVGDAYDLALTAHMQDTTGMALSQVFHSYGHLRRLCNSNVSGYPHLFYKNAATPYYTAYTVPSHSDYVAAKAALAPFTSRAAGLDSLDVVVMHGLTPRVDATADATAVYTEGATTLAFIGPGTLTVSGLTSVEDPNNPGEYIDAPYEEPPENFGPGLHLLEYNAKLTYTPSNGGRLFPRLFPTTRIEQGTRGQLHAYISSLCAGQVKAESTSRMSFTDQVGSFDVLPSTSQSDTRLNNLGPGQIRVSPTGFGMVTNINVWASMRATEALLPLTHAQADFPDMCTINKV